MRPARRATEAGAEREETAALLALSRVPGLGPRGIRVLLERCGGAREVVRAARGADAAKLLAALSGTRGWRGTLAGLRGVDVAAAHRTIDAAHARGLKVLVHGSHPYPRGLADLSDPPPLLFVRGPPRFEPARTVALVGTRAATPYGLRCAYRLAGELARWGWTVVSGMARGVDARAHAGALDAGGRSIGVLGSGHDHIYPRENRELFARMGAGGLLVSEFEPSVPPSRATFPRRNRLIAALSRAVVVVEAGDRSGAHITADHALDLGREVLAVPCRIDDPGAGGALKLLRQGAAPAADARDVFEAAGWLGDLGNGGRRGSDEVQRGAGPDAGPAALPRGALARDGATRPEVAILHLLGSDALSADQVALRLELTIAAALAALGRLELDGWIERRADGAYSRAPRSGPR